MLMWLACVAGERHRENVLQSIAASLEGWAVQVKREKAVYHTLNKFSVDVTRKALPASCGPDCLSIGTECLHARLTFASILDLWHMSAVCTPCVLQVPASKPEADGAPVQEVLCVTAAYMTCQETPGTTYRVLWLAGAGGGGVVPGQREGACTGRAAGRGAGHLRNGAPCRAKYPARGKEGYNATAAAHQGTEESRGRPSLPRCALLGATGELLRARPACYSLRGGWMLMPVHAIACASWHLSQVARHSLCRRAWRLWVFGSAMRAPWLQPSTKQAGITRHVVPRQGFSGGCMTCLLRRRQVGTVFQPLVTYEQPPTYFATNKVTSCFQEVGTPAPHCR